MGALSQLVSAGAVKEHGRLKHRGAAINTGRPARSGFKQTACPETGRQQENLLQITAGPPGAPANLVNRQVRQEAGYVPGKPRQTPAGQPGKRSNQRAHPETVIAP